MALKAIENKDDYNKAISHFEILMKNKNPTQEILGEMKLIACFIEAYEKKAYPFAPPTPAEAIKFRKEQEQRA